MKSTWNSLKNLGCIAMKWIDPRVRRLMNGSSWATDVAEAIIVTTVAILIVIAFSCMPIGEYGPFLRGASAAVAWATLWLGLLALGARLYGPLRRRLTRGPRSITWTRRYQYFDWLNDSLANAALAVCVSGFGAVVLSLPMTPWAPIIMKLLAVFLPVGVLIGADAVFIGVMAVKQARILAREQGLTIDEALKRKDSSFPPNKGLRQ